MNLENILQAIQAADIAIVRSVVELRVPSLTILMRYVSALFAAPTIVILIFAEVWDGARQQKYRSAFWVASSSLVAFLSAYVIKYTVSRPRPMFLPLSIESEPSFPSAHAAVALAFVLAVAYGTRRRITHCSVLFGGLVLAALVGISRIYLGVHYASDVLAGFVVGGCAAWLSRAMFRIAPFSRLEDRPLEHVQPPKVWQNRLFVALWIAWLLSGAFFLFSS